MGRCCVWGSGVVCSKSSVWHITLSKTPHHHPTTTTTELTGFQGSDATLLLPLDSDRLWRGSYKGKDWRYLGDGAWAPKVPQHKPPKHHRRGRGGPRTSSGGAAHGGANGSGMDSDAHSDDSSSDDERVSDKVLRDSNAMVRSFFLLSGGGWTVLHVSFFV